jgi:hypothetical protein
MPKKKKWRVVMVITDEWNDEAGYLTPLSIIRILRASLDLPPSIEILSMGVNEANKR